MKFTGVVEKNAIKLPPEVRFPDGTEVRIESIEPASLVPFGSRYAEFVGAIKDAPADLAENHDHYLYGAQKRGA